MDERMNDGQQVVLTVSRTLLNESIHHFQFCGVFGLLVAEENIICSQTEQIRKLCQRLNGDALDAQFNIGAEFGRNI